MIKASNYLSENGKKPHALLLMDPWTFPLKQGIESGELHIPCPAQLLNSPGFHSPYSETQLKRLLGSSGCETSLRHENLIVEGSFHKMQCDVAMICPLDVSLSARRMPSTSLPSIYQLYINLMLVYLNKLDES